MSLLLIMLTAPLADLVETAARRLTARRAIRGGSVQRFQQRRR